MKENETFKYYIHIIGKQKNPYLEEIVKEQSVKDARSK